MSEYSAEELLRLSQFVKDMQSILGGSRDDNDDDEARAWDDYEKASSALTAYAERIEAAQVDPAAKPRTLSDFVHASDAERLQIGQQVAARVDEMLAEPVAQGDGGHAPAAWRHRYFDKETGIGFWRYGLGEPQPSYQTGNLGFEKEPLYLRPALAAQPRAVPAESAQRGTFECPICGYDKPHGHAEDNQFPWHMRYRDEFERIVRLKIRQVGGEFLFGGMRLNGYNQYLAYCGATARQEGGWAELTRSGEYRNEWLQALWSLFKDAVLAAAPSPGESA